MLRFDDFPETTRLMLLLARTHPRDGEVRQIAEVAGEVEAAGTWADFLEVTAHHKLGPLVFETLDQLRPAGVPAEVTAALRGVARVNAFEAARAAAEIRRISKAFSEAGMGLATLKGLGLSQMVFGSANARSVGDLDVLVEARGAAEKLPRQIELMAGLGYECVNPAVRLTRRRARAYVRYWKDATFRSSATGFELDLHWRLFNHGMHGANEMLRGARYETVTVLGVPMRVLRMREQFVYCAAHGMMDAWTYLKGLADVAGFLRVMSAEELDAALKLAEEFGLLAQVSAAVNLANAWMGAGVASGRLLGVEEATFVAMVERVSAGLARHDWRPMRDDRSPAEWLRLETALVPGLRARLVLAGRYAWRPRVWGRMDLPDELFWLYPVVGMLMPPRTHRGRTQMRGDAGSG